MTSRKFAIGLLISTAVLFIGTAVINVVIDPVGVFGTELFPNRYPNYRFLGLRYYQRDRQSIDAIMFASSRGYFMDEKLVAKGLGAHKLHNSSVPYGLITDHLPILDFALRDKASRGEKLNAVLLLVDIDLLGKPPWTNTNIDCFLPPEVLGANSYGRFWWRYMTSVQIDSWREGIRRMRLGIPSPDPTGMRHGIKNPELDGRVENHVPLPRNASELTLQLAGFPGVSLSNMMKLFDAPKPKLVGANAPLSAQSDTRFRGQWISSRPDIERQLAMIETFVRLCREYGVKLTVVTTPLKRENINRYLPGELEAIGDRVSRITDVWDFATPGPVTDRPEVWGDYSHYSQAVGTMMITRMFGGDVPVPEGFGHLRPQTVR